MVVVIKLNGRGYTSSYIQIILGKLGSIAGETVGDGRHHNTWGEAPSFGPLIRFRR